MFKLANQYVTFFVSNLRPKLVREEKIDASQNEKYSDSRKQYCIVNRKL